MKYEYHSYYDPMRAIRNARWKLIANFENAPWQETAPDYFDNGKSYVEVSKALNISYQVHYHTLLELFDLENDPHELHNLADDSNLTAIRDELLRGLRKWMEETGDSLFHGPMDQGAYRQPMSMFKKWCWTTTRPGPITGWRSRESTGSASMPRR